MGRKTANLILGDVYHTPGVVVADTHCIRITGLLGLTDGTKDPGKVEKQLRAILPPEESNDFCHRLVLHGRAVCTGPEARLPQLRPAPLVRPFSEYPGGVMLPSPLCAAAPRRIFLLWQGTCTLSQTC